MPFRNAEYISAFYFIPKSILDKFGEEINSIPRNPRKLLQDRRAIEVIESDFINVNLKMYSFDHLRMYNFDHINTCCSRR